MDEIQIARGPGAALQRGRPAIFRASVWLVRLANLAVTFKASVHIQKKDTCSQSHNALVVNGLAEFMCGRASSVVCPSDLLASPGNPMREQTKTNDIEDFV